MIFQWYVTFEVLASGLQMTQSHFLCLKQQKCTNVTQICWKSTKKRKYQWTKIPVVMGVIWFCKKNTIFTKHYLQVQYTQYTCLKHYIPVFWISPVKHKTCFSKKSNLCFTLLRRTKIMKFCVKKQKSRNIRNSELSENWTR